MLRKKEFPQKALQDITLEAGNSLINLHGIIEYAGASHLSLEISKEGNIGIYAAQITNKKRQFAIEKYQTSQVRKEETIPIRDGYKNARRTYVESIIETVATKDSAPGQIIAGQNMELKGAIENNVSTITAGGALDFDSTKLNNLGYGNTRFTSRSGSDIYTRSERYCKRKVLGKCISHGTRDVNDNVPYHTDTSVNLPGFPAIFTANKRITGQAVTVNNKTITIDGAPIGSGATTVKPEKNIGTGVATTVTPGQNTGTPVNSVNGTGMPQQTAGTMTSTAIMQTGQHTNIPVNSASGTGLPQQSAGNMAGIAGAAVQTGQSSIPVTNASSTGLPQQTVANVTSITGAAQQSGENNGIPVKNINGIESPKQPVIPVVSGEDGTSSISKSKNQEVKSISSDLSNKKFSLPTSGLYTVHSEPGRKYLVETDPRFANYRNFLSSDYMLQKLSYDPEKNQKRLGDAFYEQKLINQQILELTGKRYLDGFTSNEEEYKHLLNNGVTYAKEFTLQPGIGLTTEQIAKLTSDMVWLVEEEVQGQKVLVPVVYLAQIRNGDLKPSGALMAADDIQIKATGDFTNTGVIKAKDQLQLTAGNIINRGGTIDSAKELQLKADQDILNQSGSIIGGQVELKAGRDIKNETLVSTLARDTGFTTMVNQQASISASQGLSLKADRDILMSGGQSKAVQDITLEAGHNLELASAEHKERVAFTYGSTRYEKDATTHIVSTLGAGGNVNLITQGDATLHGTQVNAGKDLTLTSGGNINITAVKDRMLDDLGSNGRASSLRNKTDVETVIGSNLLADKNIKIEAVEKVGTNNEAASTNHGNIVVEGSRIRSKNGGITVTAEQDITVTGTTERQESLKESRIVSEGFLSKKVTEKRDQEILNAIKGSTLSGETVEMKAGKDLTIQGSNVVGTKDVNLSATNQIHLDSQEETGKTDHYSFTKKSGLFGGSGLGFTIGSKSEKTTTKEQTVGAVGSTIGSEKGNIFITAGEKVHSAGTTFISGNDLTITGKAVTIDNTKNTYDSQTKYEFKQSGLSVSLGGGAVATATKAVGNLERSRQVQDDRLQALYDYKAFQDLKELNKELGNGINKESLGVSVNVSLGSSKMTSEETVHTETVNTSNINAGGNVVIKGTEKDVTLNGTKINAKDITLDAAKDITLGSGENKQETDSKTSSSSWSVGASLGATPGYFGNVSKGSGKEHGTVTTHTGSTLDATGTLTLKSGEDTNINGSQAKGEKVVADIEGDLNIASQQDTDDYTAKNKNSGIGFGTGKTGGVTGSIGKGKTDSTYNSITEQAGIIAGKDGFAIHVGKNTDLKGAVIASDATPDKNKLSTDTLTYSDIQNHAEYSASSYGVNINTRKDAEKKDAGLTPNIGVTVKGDAESTTHSAVSPGTIEVRSNPDTDLSGLSRNPDEALNALDKIFDKKTVQEKQELTKLFTDEAFKAIGDLADAKLKKAVKDAAKNKDIDPAAYQDALQQIALWKTGGGNKILLDSLVGGIASSLGGGSFASGAVGSGLNQALQGELSKIKDPAAHQWASFVIGAAASKILGGDALTGGSVTSSETKNNDLNHDQQIQFAAELTLAYAGGDKQEIKNLINNWISINDQTDPNQKAGDPPTIALLNLMAEELGLDFSYQDDSLTNNLNAFKYAMDNQKKVLYEFKIGDYGIRIIDDNNNQQAKLDALSQEWARGLIDMGFFVGRGGSTGDIVAAGKITLGASAFEELSNASKIPWTSWTNYEKVTVMVDGEAQTYAKVGDMLFSRHAVDRMQPSGNLYGAPITQAGGDYGRSVAPGYVAEVIKNAQPILQENGNISYTLGTLQVITNSRGAVVTIITK